MTKREQELETLLDTMLESVNKLREALKQLGYTADQISDIENGAI